MRRHDQSIIDSVLLHHKGKLSLVEHDLNGIAERIREIEPEYFIVRNGFKRTWEVHSTASYPDTYCFTIPFDALDSRTLTRCRETNVRLHGATWMSEFEKKTDAQEKAQEKKRKDLTHDISVDAADRAKFGATEDILHEGYHNTHIVKGV